MNKYSGLLHKVLSAIFIGTLLIMLYGHFSGYELSISWNVTTTAEPDEFVAYAFQKGPFQFAITGDKYTLAETFSAGPIERHFQQDAFFLIGIFLGICVILAGATFLSRFWFIGVCGLFIFFLINLHLTDSGLFGLESRSGLAVSILLLSYLVPAYVFHAFLSRVPFGWRLLSLLLISTFLVVFSGVEITLLQEQLISGSYFGLVILTLLFLLIIAEENIFLILFLITKARGGKNNHIHFAVFTLVYLVYLGLYYGKKSGLLDIELTYFDPYILFGISSIVALWSLKYRKELYESIVSLEIVKYLFAGLGIVVFSFLGMAFFRGNDPVYEGLHYFIVYAHLGFGALFFLYIILNFINPLSEGLQVYKIVYREQNFPYVSAKLGGLAAVVAFFFLASKEPFLLFRAGHFNYLGAQSETIGEKGLAQEYFKEGSIYGFDNHFSNYQMAYYQLQKGDIDEANYRFGRATLRFPSPHSFINQAGTYAMNGETTPSLVSLKSGLQQFPANNQLLNNLGLTYTDLGEFDEAEALFQQSSETGEWTDANLVNLWKVKSPFDKDQAVTDYQKGNLAVKTNILARTLDQKTSVGLPFDSAYLFPSYPLHRTAFLVNSAWYFTEEDINPMLRNALSGTIEEGMLNDAKHSLALNEYLSGNVNRAVRSLDQLQANAETGRRKNYLNELGLIALEQHGLEQALDYFEQAIAEGSDQALLNKAATLMELKFYKEALQWSEYLITVDSSFIPLREDLQLLSAGKENLSAPQQLSRLYYYYPDYSLAEMSVLLGQADSMFAQTLWKKISREQLNQKNYQKLESYIDLFKEYLKPAETATSEFILAYEKGTIIENESNLSSALQKEDTTAIIIELTEIANRNAFNAPVILTVAEILENYELQAAYDVLVKAIALNKTDRHLYQAYALMALKNNLVDYADAVLPKIEELSTTGEYRRFMIKYEQEKERVESSDVW